MNKNILRLAIPNIISNITVPLLGMADLAIMGHLGSEKYLGAIALAGIVFNFIYWGFSFLRMGTSGFAAQAFGQKNTNKLAAVLQHALLIALAGGALLILLQYPIQKLGFYFLDSSEQVKTLAVQYFYIRIFAAPATIGLYALNGWFVGMQDAKTPMILAILINVSNVILDLTFVYGFGLKSDGAALGTLIAQYMGFGLAFYFIHKKYKVYFTNKALLKPIDFKLLKDLFHVNKDIFIRTIVLISVISFFTMKSAEISDRVLAVNTILLQYLLLFSFIMDGFAYSAEALAGKYFGAKEKLMLNRLLKYIFVWGAILSIVFTILYLAFKNELLYLLTDNKLVIKDAKPYLFWVSLIPLASFAGFLWDGIYIGITASKQMRNTMLISAMLVFFPLYYLLVDKISNHALWLSMVLFLLSRGITQTIYAKKAIWNRF